MRAPFGASVDGRSFYRAELIACITLTWASPVSTNRVFTESRYGTHASDRLVEARKDAYGSAASRNGRCRARRRNVRYALDSDRMSSGDGASEPIAAL